MAMEVIQTIPAAHEDALAGIAYNPINKQVYTCAEGDKAIKVWDLKTGQLLRTQTVHRGMVTCLAYTTSAKLLFSGSIDGSIGVWTDKGNLLQVVSTGWPVFSLAWSNKQRLLVAGGNSVLHIYKVDMTDVLKVKHARHNAQPSARQQQQQQEGAAGAEAGLRSLGLAADAPQVLRRVCPAFKGWKQHQKGAAGSSSSRGEASACRQDGLSQLPGERSGEGSRAAGADAGTALSSPHVAAAAGGSSSVDADIAAPSLYADSEAAGSTRSSSGPRGGKGGPGGGMCSNRQREEDFYGVCHVDVVKCIVITDSGKIFTAGFDRCICIYDTDKLDKPKEAFKRVKDPGKAGITSLAFDPHNNVLLAGSLDGVLRVWSVEGRCLDKFEGLSNRPVHVAYLPHLNNWWATGRFSKVAALDPRTPALITEFVAAPNQLLEPAVQLLYAPPGSDLVIAGTTKRQLLVWQYNPHAAHRVFCGHSDWVEGVLVCPAKDNAYDQSFLSFSADGHVACWELDAEQNCDIFRQVEDTQVVPCNVLCLLHLPDQQRVVCGCEDGTIRLHTLDARLPPVGASQCSAGPTPTPRQQQQQQQQSSSGAALQARDSGGGLLPTVWTGHEGKVTGLVLLPNNLILSCSEDRSWRVWDLKTMKQLHVELDAHDSAIQCLEYCAARKQAATCGMGAKVKIWSLARPTQPTLALVLDHTDPSKQQQQQEEAAAAAAGVQAGSTPGAAGAAAAAAAAAAAGDVNPDGTSNMRWLIKSELAEGTAQGGKRKGTSTLPDIVAEAIAHAAEDVPEVMQVRWIGFKDCWVTAADDGLLRLWSTAGSKVEELASKGGPCRFQGHQDIISGIGHLPAPLDCYVTSSWDQQLRLWRRPQPGGSSGSGAGAGASRAGVGGRLDAPGLLPEDSEEGQVVLEYEKAHPLVVPKALSQDHTSALLKAIGITDGGKPNASPKRNGGRGGGRRATREAHFSDDGSLSDQEAAADAPGSLGAKLQELGRQLLQDTNETAGHHSAGERGLGMQRLNSAGARSEAAPQQQLQLRRGGPTGSRRER